MHSIARVALNRLVPNIQVSWVRMGANGAAACLEAGANDLGEVLMDESITRAADGSTDSFSIARTWRALAPRSAGPFAKEPRSTPPAGEAAYAASGCEELERI